MRKKHKRNLRSSGRVGWTTTGRGEIKKRERWELNRVKKKRGNCKGGRQDLPRLERHGTGTGKYPYDQGRLRGGPREKIFGQVVTSIPPEKHDVGGKIRRPENKRKNQKKGWHPLSSTKKSRLPISIQGKEKKLLRRTRKKGDS